MNRVKCLAAALLLTWMSGLHAQTGGLDDKDNREIWRMGLYPADSIMQRQKWLGITPEQRKDIAGLVREFQGEVTELQWSMPNEQQKLRELLQSRDIDAEPALAQAEKVLNMETQFKLAHFRLLIAIKNQLTDEQIEKIDSALRRRMQRQTDVPIGR